MKRLYAWICTALLLGVLGSGACGRTVLEDCSVSCDSAKNTCVQKCHDDQCKTQCETELNNCKLSCGRVSTGGNSGGGGSSGGGGY